MDMSPHTNPAPAEAPIPLKKHGGARNKQTWRHKLDALDCHAIKHFLAVCECGCKDGCLKKVRCLGTVGEDIIHALRESRFAGTPT